MQIKDRVDHTLGTDVSSILGEEDIKTCCVREQAVSLTRNKNLKKRTSGIFSLMFSSEDAKIVMSVIVFGMYKTVKLMLAVRKLVIVGNRQKIMRTDDIF